MSRASVLPPAAVQSWPVYAGIVSSPVTVAAGSSCSERVVVRTAVGWSCSEPQIPAYSLLYIVGSGLVSWQQGCRPRSTEIAESRGRVWRPEHRRGRMRQGGNTIRPEATGLRCSGQSNRRKWLEPLLVLSTGPPLAGSEESPHILR